jgi:hypothetical protein
MINFVKFANLDILSFIKVSNVHQTAALKIA